MKIYFCQNLKIGATLMISGTCSCYEGMICVLFLKFHFTALITKLLSETQKKKTTVFFLEISNLILLESFFLPCALKHKPTVPKPWELSCLFQSQSGQQKHSTNKNILLEFQEISLFFILLAHSYLCVTYYGTIQKAIGLKGCFSIDVSLVSRSNDLSLNPPTW